MPSVCAERVCFSVCIAALSSHVSRWACVVAESVQQVQKRREQWGGDTTQAMFDARKVSKERGWGWGECERVGEGEGVVERGIENGRGKRGGESER